MRLKPTRQPPMTLHEAPALKASPKDQRDRFVEAARAIGADEDEAAFREKLAVIARQKPKDVPKKPPEAEEDA